MSGQDGSATGPSGATANGTSDNVETSSKRSLAGRRRDASTGSKRSNRQVTGESEKNARPGSAGRAQASSEPRPKKRGGFLSFLSCCGSSDENQELGSRESTQPPKTPATASQPAKVKSQQQQIPPNASATNTSVDGSKEVIDEKVGHQSNHKEPSAAVPILPSPPAETEKPPPLVVQPDNAVPSIPPGVATVKPNAETNPLQTDRTDLQPETPTTGPSHIDTTQRNVAHDSSSNSAANPSVSVIAPTPTVPHSETEDNIIQDRTPEQAARDTDIEMTDAGPSLPLATSDVRQSPDVQTQTRERSSSNSSSRIDLPPPPPLAERQMQNQHSDAGVIAGAGVGAGLLASGAGIAVHQANSEPSAVSTPEQVQKWLLPPITPQFSGKKCLVLDLDETLVHSSFKVSCVAYLVNLPSLTRTSSDSSPSRFHNSRRN